MIEMEQKTINKIVKDLLQGETSLTRVQGYFYDVEYDADLDEVFFHPRRRGGDDGRSSADMADYGYVKGGPVYRAAQQDCWAVDKELRKHLAAKEQEKSIDFSDLRYNSQITRYFDEDKHEYDNACANREISAGKTIYVLTWTKEGYEIVHKY